MTVASFGASHALAHYRDEFPIFQRSIYLNSCSLGALSQRSRDRVAAFLGEWDAQGAAAWYDTWLDRLGLLRRGYARLVGARESEIALHGSVSTALGVLASAVDHESRSKVVTTELDFPTVAYQWLARRAAGIEVEIVASTDGVTVPLERIADAVDERTVLVATSHVFYATGAIQDIAAVADVAHSKGALCLIDAYQSVGQLPVDVRSAGVDFLVGGGLKWLLGGPGIAFLYVRDELCRRFMPQATGWFANRRQFAFDPRSLEWHDDARRFEQGTPALAAIHAQLGGLEVIEEIGVPRIRAVVAALTNDLVSRANESNLRPRVAADPAARTAIVCIPVTDPAACVARLAAHGIVTDWRPGHVRLSPFFYNVADDHVQALEILAP